MGQVLHCFVNRCAELIDKKERSRRGSVKKERREAKEARAYEGKRMQARSRTQKKEDLYVCRKT
jgi:hypothetical protein